MKHTNGKWTARDFCSITDIRTSVYPIITKGKAYPHFRNAITNTSGGNIDGILIANAYGRTEEIAKANAELIASAPELLKQNADLVEALKTIARMTPQMKRIAEQAIKANEK